MLKDLIGHDIVTSDGTTLLGADDKAGIAEIMAAAEFLINNPDVRHGTIRILFTTDEEIGRGVDKVDLQKLGADFGYTMDGETAGTIEDESFSADAVEIAIKGVAIHPGFAYGKMENAIRIAGAIVAKLPKDMAPETTKGRDGFIHPTGISGVMEKAKLELHHPRLHGGGPQDQGGAAGDDHERGDGGLSGLELHLHGQGAVPQHEGRARPASARSSRTRSKRSAGPA